MFGGRGPSASGSTNVIICSLILDFSLGKKYFDMHPVDLDFFQFVCVLVLSG